MRVCIVAPYPLGHAPSQRFRFEQYLRPLARAGIECTVLPLMSPAMYQILYERGRHATKALRLAGALVWRLRDLLAARRYDVVYLHREAFPLGPPVIERLLARMGRALVFDFDDAIYLPNVSPANRWVERLKRADKTATIIRLSGSVVVGSAYLGAYAARYNPAVRVIPTTIDTDVYRPVKKRSRGPVCVGWSGSRTTIQHLQPLEGVLQALHERYGIHVKTIGDRRFRIDGIPVDARDWQEATELADLSEIEVGLMPLPDEEWAKGKCGLKALQYMALGIPTVCSPVGVNPEIVTDGVNGFLASKPEEWIEKIGWLIEDTRLRERIGEAARETVEARYSVRENLPKYVSVLRTAAGKARPA